MSPKQTRKKAKQRRAAAGAPPIIQKTSKKQRRAAAGASPNIQKTTKKQRRAAAGASTQKTAKKQRVREPTALAAAAAEGKLTYRKGLQLFDSDDGGKQFVLWKRQKRLFPGEVRSFDGAYYHELGAVDVDGSNYKEKCEWSSIDEIEEWARSIRRGDAITSNLSVNTFDRAAKFKVPSTAREDMTKGFWSSFPDDDEVRQQAAEAQSLLSDDLKGKTTVKPKSLVPYKGTSIPLGADIFARFAWKTMRRGDAPSGPTPMM